MQCHTTLPLAQSFEKRMRLSVQPVTEATLKAFDSSGRIFCNGSAQSNVTVTGLWNQCVLISKDENQQARIAVISSVKLLATILITSHQSLADSFFSMLSVILNVS